MLIVEIQKPKFIRKAAPPAGGPTPVLVAATPEPPIERGVAGPGMLADTVVKRWPDHLPLHRLEQIYAREGVELARSTICRWHETLAELAAPVIAAMRLDAWRAENSNSTCLPGAYGDYRTPTTTTVSPRTRSAPGRRRSTWISRAGRAGAHSTPASSGAVA